MIKMHQQFDHGSRSYVAEIGDKETEIYDDTNGEHLFTIVGDTWSTDQLAQLVKAYCKGEEEGERWGALKVQAQMRQALGL